jgi:hypothetical protein
VDRPWLLVLCLVVFWFVPDRAVADDEGARVVLVHPEKTTPLIEEALIRTRAELLAVGLEVSVSKVHGVEAGGESDEYGVLELTLVGRAIRIQALSPDRAHEYTQLVDPSLPSVDAEVVAIRAVEALRAMMASYAREVRASDRELPGPVKDFARLTPSPEPPPTKPPVPPAPRVAQEPQDRSPTTFDAVLFAGPVVTLPSTRMGVAWAARVGALLRLSRFEAGVSLETTLTESVVRADAGRAAVGRDLVAAHVALHDELSPGLEWSLRTGAGFARYTITGMPAPGFVGSETQHPTSLLQLTLVLESWLTDSLGWYVDGQTSVVGDAPKPMIGGKSVAIVGQPGFSASAGIVFGQR